MADEDYQSKTHILTIDPLIRLVIYLERLLISPTYEKTISQLSLKWEPEKSTSFLNQLISWSSNENKKELGGIKFNIHYLEKLPALGKFQLLDMLYVL